MAQALAVCYKTNGCMISQHVKSFGLPRSRKIIKADAFASALRMRVCARTEDFVLHFMAHRKGGMAVQATSQDWAQIGLVIPKRLAKHAVRRNTLKRLAREYFRLNAGQLSAGLWVVRLHRNVNQLPLSAVQKRNWAEQLVDLFAQGQAFSAQLSVRSVRRVTQVATAAEVK